MTTLVQARDELYDGLFEGVVCPCCDQFAKIYKRQIHSTMARELITFYHFAQSDWGYLPNAGVQRGGDMVKVRYWDLIEEREDRREDGSPRTGWWRITPKGLGFIRNEETVPKYAHLYDGKLITVHGPPVSIQDTLGKRFDYHELMAA